MASKHIVLAALIMSVLAASQGEAQLLNVGSIYNVSGRLFCSTSGNLVANATTPTPPFSNAEVHLSCGGNVISSTLTNGDGVFNMLLDPLQVLLNGILSTCKLIVGTPLSSCNVNLPATGLLQAPLQIIGTGVAGLLRIINVIPRPFNLIN